MNKGILSFIKQRLSIFFILILVLLFFPQKVCSLGYDGHKIIGEISSHYLSAETKKAIHQILNDDPDSTMALASIWADLIKRNPHYDYAKPLHYVNIPKNSEGYKKSRDCFDGGCVVEAIYKYAKVLKDTSSSAVEKKEALKFIIHFIGDIHQPLHAGLESDRGGNLITVQFFGTKTNLHKVWDFEMIERKGLSWDQYADSLQRNIIMHNIKSWESIDPVIWVNESFRLAHKSAYQFSNHEIDEEYYLKNILIVDEQLKKAAIRLALFLNYIFKEMN